MDLRYIDSFLAAAKTNNFSDAADSLYISQSSLSKNIKKIEQDMDVKLFERTRSGIVLTTYGKIYLKFARRIKDLESRCENIIRDEKEKQGNLKIGTIPSASEYGTLNLIFDFIQDSGIQCQISNATSSQLEKELLSGQLDMAFIKNPENEKISKVNFQNDYLVAVLSENDSLAKKQKLKVRELKDRDFIFEPVNSRPYQLCVALCKSAGFIPNVIYADHYIENIIDFVRKEIGISLLMSKLVPKNAEKIKIIPIEPLVSAKINLCYLKNNQSKELKEKFVNFLKMNSLS
ncbi:LysR family transcriptional regulator [uncultured Lactobacillus sp.]|uniref:LysR family transcriptional regulator n=1 Tax=uncultured Lactobacillus sp. TaxID=153152 RepID=UPI0025D56CA1|nr:LysR family transcriptional regulator [uncultured Lactobacillus sp.]